MATQPSKCPKIPEKGKGTPTELKAVIEYGINHDSPHRLDLVSTWEQCRLYYRGKQWLEKDSDRYRRGDLDGRVPFWKPRKVNINHWKPMPVQNEMVAPIQNEIARIFGTGSKAYVRPKSADAEVEKASRLATDVLSDILERIQWEAKEYEGCNDLVLCGTMIVKSVWEIDLTDTVQIPKDTACQCAECGAKIAQTKYVEKDALELFGKHPQIRAVSEEMTEAAPGFKTSTSFTVTKCPECQSGAMLPYTATDPEETDDYDALLSEPEARGDVNVRVVSPYDFFPENDGVATNPAEIGCFREEHVETLDWIRSHYKKGVEVKAESIEAMFLWHQGGSANIPSGTGQETGLFQDSALIKEFHKKPWIEVDENGAGKLNRGRSIVIANGAILFDDDYLIESRNNPGEFVPRVVYHYMPWEVLRRELFGLSAAELILSLQDVINTTLSQVQDARHRFGSPKIIAPVGSDLQFQGFQDSGYQSDILYYQADPGQTAPQPFGGQQMAQNWLSETQGATEAISRVVGSMDVEIGNAPKNLSAASAIMYLGEKAAERRKNRLSRYKLLKRAVYRHLLQLVHEFYREDRLYRVRGRNDKWEERAFKGTDLLGQYDVDIEDEGGYDVGMFRREVIKDGLQMGTITVDSAAAKRRINKELRIPSEINEETNNQVQQAEEEWLKYLADEGEPAVCLRGDDHQIHFKTHELSFQSPEAKELFEEAQWNECELALWGWEDKYQAQQQAEQLLKQSPPGDAPQPPPPSPQNPDGSPADPMADAKNQQAAIEDWQKKVQMKQMLDALPKAPELRIALIWAEILTPLLGDPKTDPRSAAVLKVVRFKAHSEAHYQLAQQQAMAVQGGQAIPAAPGGPETGTGNIPGNPVYAFPGAGSGPGATTAAGDGGMR